jgi:hypothetical protein
MKAEKFREWYDAREGTKSESFAWDVWSAAWDTALNPDKCPCKSPTACEFHDKCLKGMK